MTEDEAKTKWCPFVRAATDQGAAAWNRGVAGAEQEAAFPATRCIGSACMAWREHHVWRNYYKKSGEPVKPGDTYTLAQVEERREPMNFCGLAGAPQ